ncbi:hypothetical protein DY000_02020557 [Brassica cretica]|uniref:Retrotransposon gag domain-containing protein n=1 Tax=Brassica cretica TaxID=69181 RepID=A0ABQ7E4W6_BRACR|nr:hypothetical protein DY000_02020557 [Brassica cretica]
MEVFHIRKYERFSLSAISLFLELEAVPGANTGVLDTMDPERFWNGDPEMRVLPPEVRRKMIREYFSPTMPRKFSFPSIKIPALQLFINLPTRLISSFASLGDKFVEQFASSRSLEKTSDSLYEILQHRVEPLRDYIACFNQEKVVVPECNIPTVISAFKRGLLPDIGLYNELIKCPCKTMEDVLSRA